MPDLTFSPAEFRIVSASDCQPEMQVLLHHLSRHFADAPPAPPPVADPRILFEVARLNKLTLFLPRDVAELPSGCAALSGWIDTFRLRTLAMNRRSLKVSAEVTALLDAKGIAHVHFKGPLQQVALYYDPSRKPVGDVDLLVRDTDRAQVDAVLRRAGFQAQGAALAAWWWWHLGELHFARSDGGPVVDVHRRLQQPGSPSLRRTGGFLDRAVAMEFEGRRFPVLSAQDRCLLASISVVKALFGHEPCAGYLVDLRASLDRLTPAEARNLPALAKEHRQTETLAFASHAVDALFEGLTSRRYGIGTNPLPLGSDVLRRMLVTPWDRTLVWPRRRAVLWALCGRAPLRYGREAAWAALSDSHRRVVETFSGTATAKGSQP